jgi:hypothetical protein
MWIWTKLLGFAGSGRTILIVAIALAVTLISYGLIQYGKSIVKYDNLQEQHETYKDTRERIDDATKHNPSNDPAISLDRLRGMEW